MATSFLLSACLIFIPAALVSQLQSLHRGAFSQRLPVNVSVHFALMAILSAISFGFCSGLPRLLGTVIFSTWGTHHFTSRLQFRKNRETVGSSFLWILAALIVVVDLFLIFHESGWAFQKDAWLWPGVSYFRPPFPHDIERDVVIVNALIRGGGSPYLPDSGFAYQLLWYHWAAPIVSLFSGISTYPFVTGCILTTALVFFYVLLTTLSLVKPTWTKNGFALTVIILCFLHTDWYSAVRLYALAKEFGIETDLPSQYPLFFRSVSLKNLTLIAPQHALFMAFLIQYLFGKKTLVCRDRGQNLLWEVFFGILCWILSPILAAFSFPAIFLGDILRKRGVGQKIRSVEKNALICIIGLMAYFIVLRSSPILLLKRPDETKLFLPSEWRQWLPMLPATWAAVLGLPGVIFSLLLIFRRKFSVVREPEFIFVFFMLLFFQFIYGHGEIRRYASLTACALLPFVLFRLIPRKLPVNFSVVRVGLPLTTFVALLLHYIFLKSFLLRPSVLDPTIPWKDYLTMNQFIGAQKPMAGIVGAFGVEVGTEKSTLMEAVPSLADPVEVAIHTELTPEKFSLLRKARQSGRPLPYAQAMGYDGIIWGPIEERLWGSRERRRFIGQNALPLLQSGTVALYPLRDLWKERLRTEPLIGAAAGGIRLAEWAAEEGWHYEAADELFGSLRMDPKNAQVHLGLSRELNELGFSSEAENHLKKFLELQ